MHANKMYPIKIVKVPRYSVKVLTCKGFNFYAPNVRADECATTILVNNEQSVYI